MDLLLRRRMMMLQQSSAYSVEWNQLITNFTASGWGKGRADWERTDNEIDFTNNTDGNIGYVVNNTIATSASNVFYLSAKGKVDDGSCTLRMFANNPDANVLKFNTLEYSSKSHIYTENARHAFIANYNKNLGSASFKDLMMMNLTQMFGAGNEPSNVAEFEAWLIENNLDGYQPYNSGERIQTTKPSWLNGGGINQ